MADAPTARTPGWRPCDLCEVAWDGLIQEKLRLEQRLKEAQQNHDAALRLYAQWRSRAERAEAALSPRPKPLGEHP